MFFSFLFVLVEYQSKLWRTMRAINCHLKSVRDKAHLGRGGVFSIWIIKLGILQKCYCSKFAWCWKEYKLSKNSYHVITSKLITQWHSPLHPIQTSNIKTCSFFKNIFAITLIECEKSMLFGKTKCPPLHAFHFYKHPRFFVGKKIKKMSCKALRMSLSDLGLCFTPPCKPFIPVKLTPHALGCIKNFH
jgi:hypothetical protein